MNDMFLKKQQERIKLFQLLTINIIGSLVLAIIFVSLQLMALFMLVIFFATICGIVIAKKIYDVSIRFKNNIIAGIFKEKDQSFKFDPKGKLDENYIYSSKVLTKNKGNKYQSSDLLEGCIDNHNFKSSDLYIYYVQSNGKNSTTIPVFSGRFYVIDLNYNIDAHIVIRKEGNFLKSKPKDLNLVEFESIEFNKTFNVYSSCGLEAFKKIKPQQIERIISLQKEHNSKLLMAIKDDKLYFGFWNNKNYFEIWQYTSYEDVNNAVLNEIDFIKTILSILK